MLSPAEMIVCFVNLNRHPMFESKRLAILVCLILVGWTSDAFAWNDIGHITIARIAYSRLSDDERLAIANILKQHPHYDIYFKRPAGLDVPDDEYAFLRAATWSDFIRPARGLSPEESQTDPISKFHRGPWHYVNFPYKPGQDTSVLPNALIPTEPIKTNILEQLQLSHDIAKGLTVADPGKVSETTEAQNRAVRVAWVFHLVGDLHQPMHAVALVNQDLFPGPTFGDNGGNFVMIRTSATAGPSNLHAYWDNLLGFSKGWRDGTDAVKLQADVARARELTELLTHNPVYAPEKLTELTEHPKYVDWAFESFQLATSTAYDQGNLKFVAQRQLQDDPSLRDTVPVLPPLLQEKAHAVGNRRATLAGYRLAEQLQDILRP